MLHVENEEVRKLLFQGKFGLEKENLRVTADGYMAHTPNPFPAEPHITRDFCENQVEINTPVVSTAEEAVESLAYYTKVVEERLTNLPEPEHLWRYSNPPVLRGEDDIPIAQFAGDQADKTRYREHLSVRYGRYKMAFCGIHVNYSFSEELLRADFALSEETDFRNYKDQFYLVLAERAAAYSWILTAVTAASPMLDSSYLEPGREGEPVFSGMGSVRASELGYWNYFTPILSYDSVEAYTERIRFYVDLGLIEYPSELYYPVRLKPPGAYQLEKLVAEGIDHIELRMFDLNPLCPENVDVRDVKFAQLLLIWLASSPRQPFARVDQVQAAQNFKNAAHYDWKVTKIVVPGNEWYSVEQAGRNVIGFLRDFYRDYPEEIHEILDFEERKFNDPEARYAHQLRNS